jgi:hypothetical protein
MPMRSLQPKQLQAGAAARQMDQPYGAQELGYGGRADAGLVVFAIAEGG